MCKFLSQLSKFICPTAIGKWPLFFDSGLGLPAEKPNEKINYDLVREPALGPGLNSLTAINGSHASSVLALQVSAENAPHRQLGPAWNGGQVIFTTSSGKLNDF